MKKSLIQNLLFAIALLIYHIFFWQRHWGLNVLLFTGLMIGALFYIHEDSRTSSTFKLTVLGTVIAAVSVVIFNSVFSKVIYTLSCISMVGFAQQRELRFLWYGLLLALYSMLSAPITAFEHWAKSKKQQPQWFNKSWRFVRLSILPMIIVVAFFGLYSLANSQFGLVAFDVLDKINKAFGGWFASFTPAYFLFSLLSFLIIGGMVWKSKSDWLAHFQLQHQNTIERKRKPSYRFVRPSMIALKNEYRSALILLATLNLLTFLVNLTDFQHTWLGFMSLNPYNISMDVHFGTYILIFTIIIAISLLMYYFRRNLNFYKKNKWLKIAAYAWVAQNIFLALSVALRNIKYVDFYGLTYKRLGVFIFLLLVLYGLTTVIQKIKNKKTAYFLFQHNAWALYFAMIILSAVNWDTGLTNYNLGMNEKANIDFYYLIQKVSDKNLPQLLAYQEKIPKSFHREGSYEQMLERKKGRFLSKMKHRSWLEWNYADHRTLLYLKEHHLAD